MNVPTRHNYLTDAIVRMNSEIEAELAVIPERPSPEQLLSPKYAADLLMVSPRTLEAWRKDGKGPPVTRVAGMPRYQYAHLVGWILDQNRDAVWWQQARDDFERLKEDRDATQVEPD